MNTKASLTIVSLAAALGMSAPTYGQVTVSQNVTFALVETYTAPALAAKDESGIAVRGADLVESNSFSVTNARGVTTSTEEYGTKMVTFRISNKEILEDLVEQGVIENITGYAIQLIGSPDEEGYIDSKFYVVKRGETPIDISEYFSAESGAEAENYNYRSVKVYTPSTETETTTVTGKSSGKELIQLHYSASVGSLEIEGIASWVETYRLVGTDPDQVSFWLPGAGTVTSIVGSMKDSSSREESDSLIEGRISVTAGVVTISP